MSPYVDIGQVEGAFVMGMGYWLNEKLVYDDVGNLLNNRSWVTLQITTKRNKRIFFVLFFTSYVW